MENNKIWIFPANSANLRKCVLIMNYLPSGDGKYIAYTEKDYALNCVMSGIKQQNRSIKMMLMGFSDLTWSPTVNGLHMLILLGIRLHR